MSVFIIISSIAFAFFVITKPRQAFFTFTFLLPFMPRYLAIGFGSGMALSLKRLFVYILFCWMILSGMAIRKYWSPVYDLGQKWIFFISLLSIMYGFKLMSTLMGSGLYNLVYLVDELLVVVIILSLAFRYLQDYQNLRTYIIVLVSSLMLSELLTALEYSLGHPLLQGFISIEVYQSRDAMEGFVRGNRYRTLAGFDNPLLLSEFICVVAPMISVCYSMRYRLLSIIAATLIVPSIYFTGSRSGFVVLMVSFFVILITTFHSKIKNLPGRFLVNISVTGVSFIIMGISIKSIIDPYWVIETFTYLNSSTYEIISTMARLGQYEIVYKALTNKLINGFGLMQNYSAVGVIGLDSYYLRLLLEGGVIVLLLYITHIVYIVIFSLKLVKNTDIPLFERKLAFALPASIISFIVVRMFVAMPFNNTYFYILSSLTMILYTKYSRPEDCFSKTK